MRNISLCVVILALLSSVYCGLYSKAVYLTENNPEELLRKWEAMENATLTGVRTFIKKLMPALLNSQGEMDISDTCVNAVLQTISDITQLKMWALKLLDATGKPGGGQLETTMSSFGNYRECLDVRFQNNETPEDDFKGQYCLVDFRPILPYKDKPYYYNGERMTLFQNYTPKTELMQYLVENAAAFRDAAFRFGICIPSACSVQDLKNILAPAVKEMEWQASVSSCEIQTPTVIQTDMWITLSVVIVFLTLVVVATAFDYYSNPKLSQLENVSPVGRRLLVIFSTRRAVQDVFAAKQHSNLSFLHGIRVFSITWVILGHTYLHTDSYFIRQLGNILSFAKTIEMQVILNGYLSVDSFFFITAVLTSYHILKAMKKSGKKVFNVPVIIFRRIYKFATMSMLLVAIIIWLPILNEGPMWKDLINNYSDTCRKNWWYMLLFVNNFVPSREVCAMHTWYLSVDMQFLIVALIYVWVYSKNESAGHAFLVFLCVFSVVSTGVINYVFDDIPVIIFSIVDQGYLADYPNRGYFSPNIHVGVFALGLALGTFLSKEKVLVISKKRKVVGWIGALALGLASLYLSYIWNNGGRSPKIYAALYSGLSRTTFGVALFWMCLVCSTGNGGLVSKLLSWKGFHTLNKFTFMLYVFHMPVIHYYSDSLKGPMDFENKTLVWMFFGNLGISFIVAVVIHLLFEYPLNQLDRFMFSPPKVQKSTKQNGKFDHELQMANLKSAASPDIRDHVINSRSECFGTDKTKGTIMNVENEDAKSKFEDEPTSVTTDSLVGLKIHAS